MHLRTFESAWSMCEKLYNYMLQILPEGSTMVELGSGWASEQFSKHYEVYSVEHNEEWVGKYDTHYIYAPIIDGWYSIDALKENLPQKYDLIFDDVQRKAEYDLMKKVADYLKRKVIIKKCGKKSLAS